MSKPGLTQLSQHLSSKKMLSSRAKTTVNLQDFKMLNEQWQFSQRKKSNDTVIINTAIGGIPAERNNSLSYRLLPNKPMGLETRTGESIVNHS